jgi:hypothetical protein
LAPIVDLAAIAAPIADVWSSHPDSESGGSTLAEVIGTAGGIGAIAIGIMAGGGIAKL